MNGRPLAQGRSELQVTSTPPQLAAVLTSSTTVSKRAPAGTMTE